MYDDKGTGAAQLNGIGFRKSSIDRRYQRPTVRSERRLEVDTFTLPAKAPRGLTQAVPGNPISLRTKLFFCCVHDQSTAKPLAENCRLAAEPEHRRGNALTVALDPPLKEGEEFVTGSRFVCPRPQRLAGRDAKRRCWSREAAPGSPNPKRQWGRGSTQSLRLA